MKLKPRPLGDRIIIEPDVAPEKSTGGIYIPETVREQQQPLVGTVLYVGPGKRLEDGSRLPMEIKEGQRVLYGKYSGVLQEVNAIKLLIMSEIDVIAVLEPVEEVELRVTG